MLNLVHIRNGHAVTSSRTVAEVFGKRHDHVLRDIDDLNSQLPKIGGLNNQYFIEDKQTKSRGISTRIFYMTRDGFVLLAMGFTGKKALDFKIAYINAFNAMEEQLENPNRAVEILDEEQLIMHALEFAEKLSKKLMWLTDSEIESKRLAIEFTEKRFNLDLAIFSEFLPKSAEFEILTVTQIAGILKIEANDVNRILRRMKFQRQFRNRWIPTGEGLKHSIIDPYTKWKTSVIEIIKTFLAERLDE